MHIDDFNLCKTHYSVVYDHNFSQFIKQVAPLKNQFEYQHKMHSFFVQKRWWIVTFSYRLWWRSERQWMHDESNVSFQSCKIESNPIFCVIKSQSLEANRDSALCIYNSFILSIKANNSLCPYASKSFPGNCFKARQKRENLHRLLHPI